MNADIRLRKFGEPDPDANKLPRGVQAIVVGDRVIFVRKIGHRMLPVSPEEQDRLAKKHLL